MLLNKMLAITMLNNIQQSEMADLLRSNGKIYVVVAVLSIIFIGIVLYLILLDKKMNKLEKMIGDRKENQTK